MTQVVSIHETAEIPGVRLEQQSENLSNPDSGYWVLFVKSTGLYLKNSSGTVVGPIGSGIANDGTFIKIGGESDYIKIRLTNGEFQLSGGATTFLDLLQPLIGEKLESPSSDIVTNVTEGSLSFKKTATLSDYVVINLQLGHEWLVGSAIYPHIHWWQTSSTMPNWLIQYRWQTNGSVKTTSWTPQKYTTNVFTYTSGILNQITKLGTITPPVGAKLSDILQVRLLRDSANASTLFTGVDTLDATADVVNFDIHFEVDSLGSFSEYDK